MDSKLLNNNDYCRAAKKIKCKVSAIKAVGQVESRGQGFYSNGFPVILFERHKFREFTNHKYDKTHPHLSGPQGGYGPAGQNQRNKFNEAMALNPVAAMKSCSWGKFQIMGFNYDICGYSSVGAFVDAMKESEGKHLDAFVAFVLHNHLDKHIRSQNWAAFAHGYNGPSYKENQYDTKMEKAFDKFEKENINCDSVMASFKDETKGEDLPPTKLDEEGEGDGTAQEAPSEEKIPSIDEYPEGPKPGESVPDSPADPGTPIAGGRPTDESVEVVQHEAEKPSGPKAWAATIGGWGASLGISAASFGGIFAHVTDNPVLVNTLIFVGVGALVAGLIIWAIYMVVRAVHVRSREKEKFELAKLEMQIKANPALYNVKLVTPGQHAATQAAATAVAEAATAADSTETEAEVEVEKESV